MFIELTLKNTEINILININHIENIMEDGVSTLVCFNSGESFHVTDSYESIKIRIALITGGTYK